MAVVDKENLRARSSASFDRFKELSEVPMMVLALLLIPLLVIPALTDLSAAWQRTFESFAWLIWAAFVFEYLMLLWLAPDRRQMVKDHKLELVLIVAPMLRPLRALRAVRLLRVASGFLVAVKLCQRLARRRGFSTFVAVAITIIFAAAGLVLFAEGNSPDGTIDSFEDALWWAIVTSTTVGYGDFAPATPEGRAIAVVLMLLGVALLSMVTANIAAMFVEDEKQGELDGVRQELADVNRRLDILLGLTNGSAPSSPESGAIDVRVENPKPDSVGQFGRT